MTVLEYNELETTLPVLLVVAIARQWYPLTGLVPTQERQTWVIRPILHYLKQGLEVGVGFDDPWPEERPEHA